ncbi:zinc finger protein [Gracilaria domingensis]|nr:zinc finger protein [Gracilaria domingensis]
MPSAPAAPVAAASSPLALDTSSAAVAAASNAVAASNAASGSAQNVLSPFGLSARPSAAALAAAAAVDNSSFLPWAKDADQPQTIASSAAHKPAPNDPATSSAFAVAAAAAAQVACSLSTTHRTVPTSSANASMSLSDLPLFPSPTLARSVCALTQLPDFLRAPATSSISDLEPMQVTRPRARAPSARPVMSDDSPMKKSVCIAKRSIPLGVSTTATAPDPTSDRLRCHMCGQRFARRSNLFKHLRSVHDDRRRFACRSCPYKFKRQDHLLKHMRSVHDRMRNFVCDICGFGFAEKFNRDKHRRSIHMTRRAFQCPCGAYFQDREKMLKCLRCRQQSNASSTATACANGGASTGATF